MPADEIFAIFAIGIMVFVMAVLVIALYSAQRTHVRKKTVKALKWYIIGASFLVGGVLVMGNYGVYYFDYKTIVFVQAILLGTLSFASVPVLIWTTVRRP